MKRATPRKTDAIDAFCLQRRTRRILRTYAAISRARCYYAVYI